MNKPQNDFFELLFPSTSILTPEEVSEILRVSEETVRRWADQWKDSGGQEGMSGFKVGKQWRFHRQSVINYLVACQKESCNSSP